MQQSSCRLSKSQSYLRGSRGTHQHIYFCGALVFSELGCWLVRTTITSCYQNIFHGKRNSVCSLFIYSLYKFPSTIEDVCPKYLQVFNQAYEVPMTPQFSPELPTEELVKQSDVSSSLVLCPGRSNSNGGKVVIPNWL